MAKVAEIKTKPTASSVQDFLDSISDQEKRRDSQLIVQMMEDATKEKPTMWGSSMIGFGKVRYKSPATGREVDWFRIGFAPRKSNLSLHLMDLQKHTAAFATLGKYKTGAGCLYINKLADVDVQVLRSIIFAAASQSHL